MEKFVTSFSGGKDCALAMYLMKERGFIPDSIIITVKETNSWTHGINLKMIEEYEKVLGLKVYPVFCRIDNYEEEFEKTLKRIKEESDVNICVFGDIDIEQHLNWNKTRCKNTDMKAIMPLEKIDREEAVLKFIDFGFKAIIKKVNLNYLDKSFLGRELNRETIEDIKRYAKEKNIEIDLCGENGEYHTVVFDGPIFNRKLEYSFGEIKEEYQSAIIEVIIN